MEELRNFARVSASWLRSAGVHTFGDLCKHDLFELWVALRLMHPQVSRTMYYAMWAARHGCDWRQVPEQEKQRFAHLAEGLLDRPAASAAPRARTRTAGGAARKRPSR